MARCNQLPDPSQTTIPTRSVKKEMPCSWNATIQGLQSAQETGSYPGQLPSVTNQGRKLSSLSGLKILVSKTWVFSS